MNQVNLLKGYGRSSLELTAHNGKRFGCILCVTYKYLVNNRNQPICSSKIVVHQNESGLQVGVEFEVWGLQ
jgi:hypothetical protein